jgi:hypothetical protein
MNGLSTLPAAWRLLCGAMLAWAVCACQPALACGFHDQSQLRRTVMNWAYPDSLHVATAVWMAQASGQLAPDDRATQDDVTPEARNVFGYLKASALLSRFGMDLGKAHEGPHPGLAVVLLGPMLWSRYEVQGTEVRMQAHLEGPEQSDVVLVTEAPLIEALVTGRLGAQDAMQLGVMRLYGGAGESGAARAWLLASFPGRSDAVGLARH